MPSHFLSTEITFCIRARFLREYAFTFLSMENNIFFWDLFSAGVCLHTKNTFLKTCFSVSMPSHAEHLLKSPLQREYAFTQNTFSKARFSVSMPSHLWGGSQWVINFPCVCVLSLIHI